MGLIMEQEDDFQDMSIDKADVAQELETSECYEMKKIGEE